MCRWIAYLSKESYLLEDILIIPDHSLVKQVDKRFLPGLKPSGDENENSQAWKDYLYDQTTINCDGYGLTWYSTARAKCKNPDNIIPLPTR